MRTAHCLKLRVVKLRKSYVVGSAHWPWSNYDSALGIRTRLGQLEFFCFSELNDN